MAKTEKPKRGIGESFTGNVVYGPRTGFIEDIETNLMLLQNIIPKVELEVLELEVGTVTKTKVVVVGVRNVYDKQVKNAIVKKIEEIEIDGVIDSYYIRGFLQTKAESFFKQVGITEKPDILSRKLLEGRVAVFVDGSPIVLSLPFVLLEDIHASEDYYQEKTIASFLRILRCLGLFVAVIFPALYVSFLIFHYQALPLIFLTTIINQSEYLPLPPALEFLIVLFLFEILFESSIRVPKGVGGAFNLLGGLILGGSLVQSNLASPATVLVVAISSVALYLMPEQTNTLRLLRFLFLISSIFMGILGIVISSVLVVVYLSSIDEYGAPYLAPFAPFIGEDQQDALIMKDIHNQKPTTPKSLNRKPKKKTP